MVTLQQAEYIAQMTRVEVKTTWKSRPGLTRTAEGIERWDRLRLQ
jgi:hypothetical protein